MSDKLVRIKNRYGQYCRRYHDNDSLSNASDDDLVLEKGELYCEGVCEFNGDIITHTGKSNLYIGDGVTKKSDLVKLGPHNQLVYIYDDEMILTSEFIQGSRDGITLSVPRDDGYYKKINYYIKSQKSVIFYNGNIICDGKIVDDSDINFNHTASYGYGIGDTLYDKYKNVATWSNSVDHYAYDFSDFEIHIPGYETIITLCDAEYRDLEPHDTDLDYLHNAVRRYVAKSITDANSKDAIDIYIGSYLGEHWLSIPDFIQHYYIKTI